MLQPTTVTEANYPDVNILNLPYPDESFDFVLSDQVYEHIEGNPQQATDECLRVLRPGGIMVHTTCFTVPYHGPGDYWRYTPEGLAYLCRNASRVIEASGWGNPFVPLVTFLGLTRSPVPTSRWHPMNRLATYRRHSYDFMVWVVAQK
jgi:SAM-dependent methyltransferase